MKKNINNLLLFIFLFNSKFIIVFIYKISRLLSFPMLSGREVRLLFPMRLY